MGVITKKEFLKNKNFYKDEMIKGKIFIYPTDTIYGIGCNAKISSSVKKIKEIKKREEKPFSVIAPSKEWIVENTKINAHNIKWLRKLPGKYTLIINLKNLNSIAKEEVIGNSKSLGVRIPKVWFSKIVKKCNIPFVTTSVNISGEKHITKIEEIKEEIKKNVDYIIDCSDISGNPSTIIDLREDDVKIIKR